MVADFATGAGVKDEIGSGWYSYQLTAAETDTDGPLAVRSLAAGATQQNLTYQVSGSVWDISRWSEYPKHCRGSCFSEMR